MKNNHSLVFITETLRRIIRSYSNALFICTKVFGEATHTHNIQISLFCISANGQIRLEVSHPVATIEENKRNGEEDSREHVDAFRLLPILYIPHTIPKVAVAMKTIVILPFFFHQSRMVGLEERASERCLNN